MSILARARAIENQSYLVLANRAGTDDGGAFCGHSAIVDPYSCVLAEASVAGEEIISAELSLETLQKVRQRLQVFAHRREELYGASAVNH